VGGFAALVEKRVNLLLWVRIVVRGLRKEVVYLAGDGLDFLGGTVGEVAGVVVAVVRHVWLLWMEG